MEPNRKHWNEQQQLLQAALLRGTDQARAVELFLSQHACLHTGNLSGAGGWSFAEEILSGLSANQLRQIPPGGEHSIAWIWFHLARIEDVTMNLLAAGSEQVFSRENWQPALKVSIQHTGNAMNGAEIAQLSAEVDIEALKAYREAVGRRTREIVPQLQPQVWKQKVQPRRIQHIWEQSAILEDAREITDYWAGRTIAGLLLMPPTRHNFLHLNEALRLRQKLR